MARNRKISSLSLGPAGIVGGGSECPDDDDELYLSHTQLYRV